eukprot:XP_011677255.1 PREDICTED: beta-2-syntrophin [Strongylocentrotus purpuratus]
MEQRNLAQSQSYRPANKTVTVCMAYENLDSCSIQQFSNQYNSEAKQLIYSGSPKGTLSLTRSTGELTFGTRTGTRSGIEAHLFRVETRRDLAAWTRQLVQGSHNTALIVKEVTCPAAWNGRETRLRIHFENGFTLSVPTADGQVDHTNQLNMLWSYPFEKLRYSSDDSKRLLWLDFGAGEGEFELDLHGCPKPIVFIIHTFLSAKVTRMGLFA